MDRTTNKLNFWGNRIYRDVRLVLPAEIFSEMRRGDVTFNDLEQNLEEWLKWRNKTLQTNIGNNSQFLSYKGYSFSFSIYCQEFCLWDEKGATSFGSYEIKNDEPPTNEFIDWLNKKLQNYDKGIINCSDCDKEMKRREIAGRYFAGVYCKDCWESKWRAVEATEDYN